MSSRDAARSPPANDRFAEEVDAMERALRILDLSSPPSPAVSEPIRPGRGAWRSGMALAGLAFVGGALLSQNAF